jgi:hypothetical protein
MSANRRRAYWVAVLAVVVVIVCLAYWRLSSRAQWYGGPPSCLSQVQEIGMAMLIYAGNYGQYPDSLAVLLKVGYLSSPKTLICPSTGTHVPDDFPRGDALPDATLEVLKRADDFSSYVIVKGVSPRDPADFIILTEKDGAHNCKGRTCLFNNGNKVTVKWLPEAEFQKMMAAQLERMGRSGPKPAQ